MDTERAVPARPGHDLTAEHHGRGLSRVIPRGEPYGVFGHWAADPAAPTVDSGLPPQRVASGVGGVWRRKTVSARCAHRARPAFRDPDPPGELGKRVLRFIPALKAHAPPP